MSLEIIYENDTLLEEHEALDKGYRCDVVVLIGGVKFKVYVVSMVRLQQDFITEIKDSGYYLSEPNIIIVNETSKEEIEFTIKQMYECKYFEKLKHMGFEV